MDTAARSWKYNGSHAAVAMIQWRNNAFVQDALLFNAKCNAHGRERIMGIYKKVFPFCVIMGLAYLFLAANRISLEQNVAAVWEDSAFRIGLFLFIPAFLLIGTIAAFPRSRRIIPVALALLAAAVLVQSFDDDLYPRRNYQDAIADYAKQLENLYGVKLDWLRGEANYCISGNYLLVATFSDGDASRKPQSILVYDKEKKLVAEQSVDQLMERLKNSTFSDSEFGFERFYVQPATPRNQGFMQFAFYAKTGNATRIYYYNPIADANGQLHLQMTD
jgi:hypothetical protein